MHYETKQKILERQKAVERAKKLLGMSSENSASEQTTYSNIGRMFTAILKCRGFDGSPRDLVICFTTDRLDFQIAMNNVPRKFKYGDYHLGLLNEVGYRTSNDTFEIELPEQFFISLYTGYDENYFDLSIINDNGKVLFSDQSKNGKTVRIKN